ncbi:MAG: ABC transporter ATP-binding protein [Syntrophales bacterium]
MSEVLSLTGVHAYYGESHVLRGIGFSLRENRLLVLLGRNGAGKTTCINSIIGFLPPREGEILLFGQSIAGRKPEEIARSGVGLVPQGRRLFPNLTVRENLLVASRKPLEGGGPGWVQEKVFDVFPQLRDREHQLAGLLSGGEQQMLAIGRALMSNPRLVLMDEPSEGLAPQIVAEVGRVLMALKEQGLAIVLVEQNTGLALKVADDAVILNSGCVVYNGTVEELQNHRDILVANLGIF